MVRPVPTVREVDSWQSTTEEGGQKLTKDGRGLAPAAAMAWRAPAAVGGPSTAARQSPRLNDRGWHAQPRGGQGFKNGGERGDGIAQQPAGRRFRPLRDSGKDLNGNLLQGLPGLFRLPIHTLSRCK